MASESGLVRRTIKVLRAVAAHPNGVGLSEVARESEIPKATCYRVLNVLERESWLILDPDTHRYRVSFGLLSIVGGMLDNDGAYRQMRSLLADLADKTSETCGLDVLLPPNVMVVAQVAGPQLIGQTPRAVPRTQPVWVTSSGKALLAGLTPEELETEYRAEFEAKADESVGTFDDFVASLHEVRQQGYGASSDELETGASAIAAPVRVRGSYPYAVWVGGPTYRLTPEWIAENLPHLQETAKRLGELLTLSDLQLEPKNS